MRMAESIGVILAGGQSSRMGEDKAAMMFVGETLLQRAVRRLSAAVDDVLVIGPSSLQPLVRDVRVVPDLVPGSGPLGGLYTALRSSTGARIFLVACDMPFVQEGLVRAMLALSATNRDAEAVVLKESGASKRMQPLHAVYAYACLPAIERALATDDLSLRSLLAHLRVLTLDADTVRREDPRGLSALNVNTTEDWREALRMARELEAAGGG